MPTGAVVSIYKPLGLTPLAALNRWRARHPELRGVSMTYTGRLDPMAEGVVVILIGEALKRQAEFQKQDKVYSATVLFGASTDTYDVLGVPAALANGKNLDVEKIKAELLKLEQGFTFKLPPFSSYKIKGKPLFWWALMNRLPEIEIPERTVRIFRIDYLNSRYLTGAELGRRVQEKINLAKGKFRQSEIKPAWQRLLAGQTNQVYLTVSFRLHCQSGTYIRALAKHLGDKFGSGAILFDLVRERVGDYGISQTEPVI